MAITEGFSGTKAVDGTEWSLTANSPGPVVETSDNVYQLFLDVSDMVAADELQIKFYEKVRTSSTQRQFSPPVTLVGAQSSNFAAPSFILLHGWDITVRAISGTITVEWSIRQVA